MTRNSKNRVANLRVSLARMLVRLGFKVNKAVKLVGISRATYYRRVKLCL